MRRENAESSQELAQTVASGNAMRGQAGRAGRAVEEAHIVGSGKEARVLKNRGEMQRPRAHATTCARVARFDATIVAGPRRTDILRLDAATTGHPGQARPC